MELSPLTGAQSAFPSLTVTSHTPLWGKPGTSYPQAKGLFEKCHTRALLLALGACAWISVSFRDSDALHKARVLQCSVAEGERSAVPRRSILAGKGCSAHHFPRPLADHQDGPGAPLLMQAGFTTAYAQVRQSTTEKALLSIQHSRKTPTSSAFFFLPHCLIPTRD